MDGRRRLAEPVTDGAPTRPAAGTVPAARIFVMGAGVAGLQAIATRAAWAAS